MKKIIYLLALQVSLLSLTNCGFLLLHNLSKSSNNVATRDFNNSTEAEKAFNNSTISCSSGNCPEYIGGLYRLAGRQLGACSATLIGPNRVLTNNHCLSEGMKRRGASCAGKINVYLPATKGYPAERLGCSKVVALSSKTRVVDKDWAVIETTTSSSRPFATVSREGVPEDSIVTIHKVNFSLASASGGRGSIKKTQCRANTNHAGTRDFIGPQSAIVNVSHCLSPRRLIKGNSGSGIFNEGGQLVAVLSFAADFEDPESEAYKRRERRYPGIRANYGGGTNFACIDYNGHSPSEYCDTSIGYRLLSLTYSEVISQRKHSEFESLYSSLTSQISTGNGTYVQMIENHSDLFDRFDWSPSGSLGALKEVVASAWVMNAFPALPNCVEPEAPRFFNFDLKVLKRDSSEVVSGDQSVTYASDQRTMRAEAEKLEGEGEYKINFMSVNFTSDAFDIFDQSLMRIDYIVPVCDQ